MKILIVEDDQATGELLSTTLSANRYTVDWATDGVTGLELAEHWEYDLILLDVKLPQLDGIEVCRRIRSKINKTPILMLTAKEKDEDVITGLDAGADDYVTKPCNLDQLLARIRSLLRRSADALSSSLEWGDLRLDLATSRVTYQQQEISLRPKEYTLLELLLRYPQRIFSRSAILDHLWTVDNFPSEGAVTNLIKDLRRRLAAAGIAEDFIETVYGFGYRLKTIPEKQESLTGSTAQEVFPAAKKQQKFASIQQLAEQFQSAMRQRLPLLEAEIRQLLSGGSTEEQQLAKEELHRLAGSLGMYGYHRASDIARSIERLFAGEVINSPPRAKQLLQGLSELRRELEQSSIPAIERSSPAQLPNSAAAGSPIVLMISQEDDWAEALQQEARNWNWRVEVIPEWSPDPQPFVLETPAAIVLEVTEATVNEQVLRQITQQFPAIPVLTLVEEDNLFNRVAAARAGSSRYITKPVTAIQIFETVTQLLPPMQSLDPAKVLILDDDPTIHPILTRLLQPWGLEVVNLEEPEQFWQVLTQTHPDLVLLDIEMPTFNGIELCRVVRQDMRYCDLPILVITAHTEPDEIQQVFDAGADDLLHKPIVDSELVTRVIHRIERSRLQKQLDALRYQRSQSGKPQTLVDPLTQVANRQALLEFLQQVWQEHQAEQSPLSLILCDVDEFQRYSDRYGPLVGDACLQQIARAIQHCIKSETDQVARWDDAAFAVVLPNTTLSGAVSVAERIQQTIARLKIARSDDAAHSQITLSLGITGAVPTPGTTTESLIAMANRALCAAKEKGRNTYCLYPL